MAYDLTNKTFGHLTAQKIIKQDTSKHNYWECICTCGRTVVVRAGDLLNGKKTMCSECKKQLLNTTNIPDTKKTIVSTDEEWLKNNLQIHRNIEDYDNVYDVRKIPSQVGMSILNAPIVFKLVHAISADLSFSKTPYSNNATCLAEEFDKYFHIGESLKELDVCDWNVGEVIYTAPIYHLLTKEDKNSKTTYQALYKCLLNLKKHAKDVGNFYLAFPRICCGKDGLHWDIVVQMILEIFAEDNFQIMLF